MANYSVWKAGADKGDHRRVTWVCGDQPVLIQEVIDTTHAAVNPSPVDYLTFTGGLDPDRTIWAAANQLPLAPGAPRLLVIRRAQRITWWQPLEGWIAAARQLPKIYLMFISDEDDFPYRHIDGKRAGLKPHVELIKNKGRIVRCAQPNHEDSLIWIRRLAPALTNDAATYLLQRAGGNLTTAAAACAKLAVLPGTPGRASIDALAEEETADSLADNLLALRKRDALLAATRLPERDIPKTIALLEHRLDLLGQLCRAVRAGLSARDITGHPAYLVKQYLPIARHYDQRRTTYCRRVLAIIDEAARGGARTGVLEALIALW